MGVRSPSLDDETGIAGGGVHLFDLWYLGKLHKRMRFAPTGELDMDEGEHRLAHLGAVEQGRGRPDDPAGPQPLDSFVDCSGRQANRLADSCVGLGRIADQLGGNSSVETIEWPGPGTLLPNVIRFFSHAPFPPFHR